MLYSPTHRRSLGVLTALLAVGSFLVAAKPMVAAGPFAFAAPVKLSPPGTPFVHWRDLNQDGRIDLVTGSPRGVSLALRRPDGSFDAPQVHIVNPEDKDGNFGGQVIEDFDGDGFPDCSSQVPPYAHYLQNDGAGHFALVREVDAS